MNKLLLVGLLFLTGCGFEIVDTGHRGVEINFGKVVGEPLVEGLHFYNPFTSRIIEMSVREEKLSGSTSIFTKDTQRVEVEYAVVWYIAPNKVGDLYKELGEQKQIEAKIVIPKVLGSMKDSIGSIIADDLVNNRELATIHAKEKVQAALVGKGIIVSDLTFTNLDFDDAYEKAVEQKVVAKQNAEKAKNDTVRIEELAKQTIATAQADAESMRIKSKALAENKGLVEFELAKKWNGVLPHTMFGQTVPFININGSK